MNLRKNLHRYINLYNYVEAYRNNNTLPSRYTKLEYLESTGTQYIDTGIIPTNSTTSVKAQIKSTYTSFQTTDNKNPFIFGASINNAGVNEYIRTGLYTNFFAYTYTSGGTPTDQKSNVAPTLNSIYDTELEYIAGTSASLKVTQDGTSVVNDTKTGSIVLPSKSLYLFAYNGNNNERREIFGKIYSAQIYMDNTLVQDLIPAKRNSDNTIGMYDRVTNTFFTNSGTGEFIAGPELSLPAGYTKLEYIESTGTQYIDMGITPTTSTGVKVSYSYPTVDANTSAAICGTYQGIAPRTDTLFISSATGKTGSKLFGAHRGATTDGLNTSTIVADTIYTSSINWLGNGKIDSGGIITNVGSGNIETAKIRLFGRYSSGSYVYGTARIYSAQFSEDSTLVYDLVPAKRNSDNTIGMYDRVTNTFFTNSGTGTFIAGPKSSDSLLVLQDAIKDSLKSLKAYGKTELKPDTLLDTVVANGGTEILSHDYMDSITAKGKTEQRKLPVGYQELEYIESTGTQWIDTGIKDIVNSEFEITAQQTAISGNFPTIVGALDGDTSPATDYKVIVGLSTTDNKYYTQTGGSTGFHVSSIPNDTNKHKFNIKVGTNQTILTIDDINVYPGSYAVTTTQKYSLFICARNKSTVSNFTQQKVFGFTARKNDTLISNLVPARNASGVVGMYDTVSCTFFTNSGTGSFIAGPVVSLPEEYERIEYIRGTGAQYINTGIKANSAYTYKLKVSRKSPYNRNIFGIKEATGYSDAACLIIGWTGTEYIGAYSHTGTGSGANPQVVQWIQDQPFSLEFNPTGEIFKVDGVNKWTEIKGSSNTNLTNASFTSNLNIYLFGTNTAGSFVGNGDSSWYSYQVYDNNNRLLQNLVPAKNASGVVGMYDMVSGNFLTNAGTGTFTAGPSLKVPSDYTVLDYIETTDGTEYINPQLSGNARWVITAQTNAIKGSSQSLITSTDSASGGTWYGEFTSTQHWDIISGGTTIAPTTKTIADLTFDSNGATGTIGGVSVTRSIACTQGNWRIFGTVSGIGPYVGKLFDAKVYQNNTLVRNLVPVIRNSDGVIGMYDTVSGTLLTNAGTGTFKAGYKVNILPDNPVDIYCNNGVVKVRHQSGLPLGYTLLDYIESSGTQYIDTGYKSSNNTKVKAQILCPNAGTFVFGSRNEISGTAQKRFGLFFNTTWNPQYANENGTGSSTIADTIYNVEMSQDGFYVNNSLNTSFTSATFSGDYNMYLFANNTANTTIGYGSCKIYSFEIYTNNVLEHKYIPCKNSSSVLGMYDLVSGQFLTNAGTGNFVVGNVVSDPVEIYTEGTTETIYKYGKNLFNEKWNKDTGTSTQSSTWGQVVTAAGWSTSELVPVVAGEKYTVSYSTNIDRQYVFYYNADGTMQQNYNDTTNPTLTVTIPTNCTRVRLQCHKSGTALDSIQTQLEVGSNTTTYEPYTHDAEIATCEDLFSLYSYQDTQNILNGNISRNIKVLVLKGTENWAAGATGRYYLNIAPAYVKAQYTPLCSHFQIYTESGGTGDMTVPNMLALYVGSVDAYQLYAYPNSTVGATVNTWKAWLAQQYAAGTPVMIIYPLATATSETVSKQINNKETGDTIEVIAGSLKDLEVTNTSSTHTTPLPDYPLDINCNNGVLKVSKNLYNPATRTDGYYIGADGVIAQGSGTYCYSALIPVKPNTAYVLSGIAGQSGQRRLHAYNSNGNWISQISFADTTTGNIYNVTGTTPNNCIYVRISIPMLDTNVQVEEGSTATDYNDIYTDGTVETLSTHGKNLFDISTSVLGGLASADGSETVSTTRTRTGFIPFNSSATITIDNADNFGIVNTYLYNANKVFIGTSVPSTSGGVKQFTASNSNAKYIRVTFCVFNSASTNINLDTFKQSKIQIEQGSTATPYEPYYNGDTATCEDLLSINDHIDTQSILDGEITRNVGVKVFDGTEDIGSYSSVWVFPVDNCLRDSSEPLISSHLTFNPSHTSSGSLTNGEMCIRGATGQLFVRLTDYTTINQVKQYLAEQYAAGTPVIVIYPLATETTETVDKQRMRKGTVSITEASMTGLTVDTTESVHTIPSPDFPLDLYCNNGVIKDVSNGVIVEGNPEVLNIKGKNLFDITKDTTGKYIDANGNISVEPYSSYSELIEVKPGEVYTYSGMCNQGSTASANNKRIHGYINGVWNQQISVTSVDKFTPFNILFTIPNNINGIRISHWTDDTYTQLEKGTRPTQYEDYMNINCSVEDLLSVGNYQDIEDLKAGITNRKVDIKVFDGTENWNIHTSGAMGSSIPHIQGDNNLFGYCSHFLGVQSSIPVGDLQIGQFKMTSTSSSIYFKTEYDTVTAWKQWLADQYAAGTPVIVVYPLATETTESTITQSVDIVSGTNIIERNSEYLNDLGVDAEFKKLR